MIPSRINRTRMFNKLPPYVIGEIGGSMLDSEGRHGLLLMTEHLADCKILITLHDSTSVYDFVIHEPYDSSPSILGPQSKRVEAIGEVTLPYVAHIE